MSNIEKGVSNYEVSLLFCLEGRQVSMKQEKKDEKQTLKPYSNAVLNRLHAVGSPLYSNGLFHCRYSRSIAGGRGQDALIRQCLLSSLF